VTRTLFKVRSDLTAIVAYNDLVAVGALQACQELGRNVPGDVAIIGFDDIPLTSLVTPSLSTLHIPVQEIGKAAMWMLIGIIGGDTSLDRKLSFKPELVVRTSTRQVG
jgi:LacI family transcriptional regulator